MMKQLWRGWIKLGQVLAFINTRIILAAVFYIILTPLGLFLRLSGKKLFGGGEWLSHGPVDKKQLLKQY